MLFFSDCQPVNLAPCLVPGLMVQGRDVLSSSAAEAGVGLPYLVVAASSLLQLSPHCSRADAEGFVSNQRLLTPGQ